VTDENRDEQGEAVPPNWACTNCGYRIEGELLEECPECGADREVSYFSSSRGKKLGALH
jgi:rubrerythrin